MDINCEKGHLVRYIGASDDQVKFGGYDDPRGVLEPGGCYNVDHTNIESWTTGVVLEGVKGEFNSVHFEDVPSEPEVLIPREVDYGICRTVTLERVR